MNGECSSAAGISALGIAVIGVGNIGSAHADCLARGKINGARLAALCDIDPDKERALRALYPDVPFFDDAGKLFDSGLCDAVIVSAPHREHVPLGIAALERGLHLLTEKPAGVSVSDVRRLNEKAASSGRVFGIMFNQRTSPLFRRARDIFRAGTLGELTRVNWIITNWYRTQQYYDSGTWRATWRGEGGGVLLNQAPHNLDILQWICGMPVRLRASCYEGKFHHIEVEDEATLFFEYENGATGVFITSTGEYPGTNRLEISGTKGKMVLEEGHIRLFTHAPRAGASNGADIPDIVCETIETGGETGGHAAVLQNFTDAVRTGSPLIAPGEDGIYELSLSNAAFLSSWTGEWVLLPIDAEHTALFDSMLAERAASSKKYNAGPAAERGVAPGDRGEAAGYKDKWQVNW